MPSSDSHDAQLYRNLAEQLEVDTWALKTEWYFPLKLDTGCAEQEWLRYEHQQRERIDAHVRYWLKHQKLPELNSEDRYWVFYRFRAAYQFVYQFVLEDGTTVFSFPDLDPREFFEWLLIRWWDSVGIAETLYYRHPDDLDGPSLLPWKAKLQRTEDK
jgi:hypothetical protein